VLVVLGLVLIPAWGIEGAATAAVIADALLAGLLLLAIVRARRAIAPDLRFAWKVAVAGGLAASAALVPVSPWIQVVLATIAYAAVVAALRLTPPEVVDALPLRRRE
jgi:hypothetical protein